MGKTQENGRKSPTFTPPKVKSEAVRRLRQLEQEEGKGRGQVARVAQELGVSAYNLSHWAQSGEWEPEQQPAETRTLLSVPVAPAAAPAPPSLPAPPVSAVQPVTAPPAVAPDIVAMMQALLLRQQPPVAPASQPAPAMLGLEEYIRGVVRMELEAALAKQLPIALQRMLMGSQR